MPFGLVTVAVLLMVVPGVAEPEIVALYTIVTEPLAGTLMPVMLSAVPVELLVAPAGKLTTVKFVRLASMVSVTETPLVAAPLLSVRVMVYCRTSPTV